MQDAIGTWRDGIPSSILFLARFARRIVRSIVFRVRYGPAKALNVAIRRLRWEVLFPLRNAVLSRRPIAVLAGGQSFLLVPEGVIAKVVWSCRSFENGELEFVVSALRPGMTFFDIGANVGFFSLPAAKKLQNGRVFAFEPSGWTYQRLLANISINKLTNVAAIHTAVGDYCGDATLHVNATGKDGLNTIGRPTHAESEIATKETVPITTLDDFVRRSSISHVDVMKVDVEGAELFVFRGARGLLTRSDAPLILYESGFLSRGFDYHPVEQMWLLQQFGYVFFLIDSANGKLLVPPGSKAYDAMVVAVKPSHPSYVAIQELVR